MGTPFRDNAGRLSGEDIQHGKKCVLKRRSESKQTQAARRMLKINMPRMALMNQATRSTGAGERHSLGAQIDGGDTEIERVA